MNWKRKLSITMSAAVVLTAAVIAACAGLPSKYYYQDLEKKLGTRGGLLGDDGIFHDAVYDPAGVNLNFPGYIVGIEKGKVDVVAPEDSRAKLLVEPSGSSGLKPLAKRASGRGENNAHFISHILRYQGKPYGEGNCYVYSVYAAHRSTYSKGRPLMDPCGSVVPVDDKMQTLFTDSRNAVDGLSVAVANDLGTAEGYTHVIVVVMGWNTPQIKAVDNFNSLIGQMRRVGGSAFKPLVIGVTWSSYWSQSWFDALVRPLSYWTKSDDADEIGVTWLGSVVQEVAAVARAKDLPTVVIGHSFGARAASMAVCVGQQLADEKSRQARIDPKPIDLFIGLQPAVSFNRFLEGGGSEDIAYPSGCTGAQRVAFTASASDKAVRTSVWSETIGSSKTYQKVCAKNWKQEKRLRKVTCVKTNSAGLILQEGSASGDFLYIDASELVRYRHPNTGGGAHSDIYRPDVGALLWNLVGALGPN